MDAGTRRLQARAWPARRVETTEPTRCRIAARNDAIEMSALNGQYAHLSAALGVTQLGSSEASSPANRGGQVRPVRRASLPQRGLLNSSRGSGYLCRFGSRNLESSAFTRTEWRQSVPMGKSWG